MTKPKLMIIVAVIAVIAAGAGLMLSGVLKKKPSTNKVAPAWVSLSDPFVVNLADPSGDLHYAKVSVSVEPAPMTAADLALFNAKDAVAPADAVNPTVGPDAIMKDPVIRSAVVDAISTFTLTSIAADKDHAALKAAILTKITAAEQGELARVPKADRKADESPFDIAGVLITDYAIQ